jgi:hypothetical protein
METTSLFSNQYYLGHKNSCMNTSHRDKKKDAFFNERGFECRNKDQVEEESSSESGSDDELIDLPLALAGLIDSFYQSEERLQVDLLEAGIGDLPIVLVAGKLRMIMPADQHNSFTSLYVYDFSTRWSKWGFCTGSHNVHLLNGKTR